ncbi:MAG: DUF4258 domain-containing protein [Patescibacteria group bacterium]
MKIVLTDHAKERFRERDISLNVIKSVLSKPDVVKPSFDNREIAIKVVNGKTIEVVYSKEKGDKYIIITVYYGN